MLAVSVQENLRYFVFYGYEDPEKMKLLKRFRFYTNDFVTRKVVTFILFQQVLDMFIHFLIIFFVFCLLNAFYNIDIETLTSIFNAK